jgi:hypothetical protein
LRNLDLILRRCDGIRSPADLTEILMLLRPLGLGAGAGAIAATDTPRPVEDLAASLITHRWVSAQGQQAEKAGTLTSTQTMERWSWSLVRMEQPQTRGNIFITRRGAATWDILASVLTFSHTVLGVSADEFTNEWAELLERFGDVLYLQTRPALSILTATGENEYASPSPTVEQQNLVVGWRTWYGPPYVEKFGRDWFLGLPDRAQLLADGGVAHALDAPLTAIVHGDTGCMTGCGHTLIRRVSSLSGLDDVSGVGPNSRIATRTRRVPGCARTSAIF